MTRKTHKMIVIGAGAVTALMLFATVRAIGPEIYRYLRIRRM